MEGGYFFFGGGAGLFSLSRLSAAVPLLGVPPIAASYFLRVFGRMAVIPRSCACVVGW